MKKLSLVTSYMVQRYIKKIELQIVGTPGSWSALDRANPPSEITITSVAEPVDVLLNDKER